MMEVQRWISELAKSSILDPSTNFINLGFILPNGKEFGVNLYKLINSLGITDSPQIYQLCCGLF